MKRRVILFFGTFFFLLAILGVYQLITRSAGCFSAPPGEDASETYRPDAARDSEIEDTELLFLPRDEQGRLEGIYRAENWEKRDDGGYLLIRPHVRVFQTSGRELRIRADRGTVDAEESGSRLNIRRGTLEGNVEIIYDRSTEPSDIPIEQRPPENLVRIYLDDVEFSQDMLELTSENHVTVYAHEADIIGKGLIVRWDEEPAELRMLKINEGEYMVVKSATEGFEVVSLPGSASGPLPPARAPGPLGPRPLGEDERLTEIRPVEIEQSQTPPTPASAPVGEPSATSEPVSRPASRPEKPTKPKRPERRRQNRFRATFRENVKVVSGERRIEGAEELSFVFEWDSEQREQLRPLRPSAPIPSTRPSSRPVLGRPFPAQRPDGQQEDLPPQIHVVWTGPLVLEPAGYVKRPQMDRFRVDAEGRNLVLSDGPTEVTCWDFTYYHPQQAGRLGGKARRPVRMHTNSREEMSCRTALFDRKKELAELTGPGYIRSVQSEGDEADASASSDAGKGRRISWEDSVTARVTTIERTTPDGEKQSRPFISEAIFRGNVQLTDERSGDFVRGDRVRTWITDGHTGAYPTKAVVTGNVLARQETGEMQAGEVTVHFEPVSGEEGKPRKRAFRQSEVIAKQDVRIIDRRDDEPTIATAETVTAHTSDPENRSAVLEGGPATITQGDNKLAGSEIHLNELGQAASVVGPGAIELVTDRDIAGRKLASPRPVKITWSKGMKYNGLENEADLTGDVHLVSGLSSMRARHMVAKFKESAVKGATDAEEASEGAPREELSLDLDSLSQGQLAKVETDGDVVVLYQTRDQQDKLLQEMQLKADELIYEAQAQQIDCTGYGSLLIEDYRPPDRDRRDERPANIERLAVGKIERPWQTAFEWQNMMRLMLDERMVVMEGAVGMVHHSGTNVVGAKNLEVPDWGELTEGRTTTLRCGKLTARFSAPEKDGEQRTLGGEAVTFDPGSQVGDLELFVATKNVVLEDREWELQGRQLSYMPQKDFALLTGHLADEPPANARVLNAGRVTVSPKFLCTLEKGRVKTVEVMEVGAAGPQ